MTMELFPFQKDAINQVCTKFNGRALVALDMGLGKTPVAIGSALWLNCKCTVVVCPASLRLNWEREIAAWSQALYPMSCKLNQIKTTVVLSGKTKIERTTFIIISYEQATTRVLELAALKPDMMVVDESHYCLEENTRISTPNGLVKIKDLNPGDSVFSISDNGVSLGRIISKIEGDNEEPKRVIKLSNGKTINGLDWHLVRTPSGWKSIGELQVSDAVSVVREDLGREIQIMDESEVLQQSMRKIEPLSQRGLDRSDEKTKPNEERIYATESECNIKKDRAQAYCARREWEADASCASSIKKISANCISWIKDSIRIWCSNKWSREWLSDVLQNRCCDSFVENCTRSRRSEPQHEAGETTRFEERTEIEIARVESISILESGDSSKSNARYFDLKLDRYHNYIANGVIVHNCKNRNARRTKAVVALCRLSRYCLLLSGTPMLNRPIELWCQLEALNFSLGNYWAYAKKYCAAFRGKFGWDVTGSSNLGDLNQKLLANVMVRKRKSEVLTELPDKRRVRISVGGLGRSPHGTALKTLCEKALKKCGSVPSALEWLRSRKNEISECVFSAYSELATLKAETACEIALQLLESGNPLVIFAHHKTMIQALCKAVGEKYPFGSITGDTPLETRQRCVDDFQSGKIKCCILSITAASTGLTLTAATDMVIAELPFAPGVALQAEDRIHRIGQKESVLIRYLCADNTLDDGLWGIINSKNRIANHALDGIRETDFDNAQEHALGSYWITVEAILTEIATKQMPLPIIATPSNNESPLNNKWQEDIVRPMYRLSLAKILKGKL